MKYLVVFIMLLTTLYSKGLINPDYVYEASGMVDDLVYKDQKLYLGTANGVVDIFDTKTKSRIQQIKISKVKDFMGDDIDSKIFSVDVLGGKIMILSQDSGGYSRLDIYQNGKMEHVITKTDMLNIIEAKFIDKNRVLLALISNDIISFDIASKKNIWAIQVSASKFSSFALSKDKSKAVIADESGVVHLISTKNGSKIKELSGQNVDNIYSVDFQNNVVITGGVDRRSGVYDLNSGSSYYKTSNFFVYGVGLSPDGKIGAYSSDTDNNVEIFNISTREALGKYNAYKMIVNGVCFINEKEFFINSSSKKIGYFKIK